MVTAAAHIYIAATGWSAAPWEPGMFQMQHFLEGYCRDKLGS
jgi:hypothetical protein